MSKVWLFNRRQKPKLFKKNFLRSFQLLMPRREVCHQNLMEQNEFYLTKISGWNAEIKRSNGTIAKLKAQNKNDKAKLQDALKTMAKLKSENKACEEKIASLEAHIDQCMVEYLKSQNFVNTLLELVRLGTIWTNVFGKTPESKPHDRL